MSMTYEEWFASRSSEIQDAIRQFPGETCYRLRDEPGHFLIEEYTEGNPVTLTLCHARDSCCPGIAVFGMPMEDVKHCGCGKARPPTEEQIQRM